LPDRGGVNSPRRSNLLNNQCLNKRPILLDSPTEVTDLPTRQLDLLAQECHPTRSTLKITPLQGTHRVEVAEVLSNRLPILPWGFSHLMEATLHHMLPLQVIKRTQVLQERLTGQGQSRPKC